MEKLKGISYNVAQPFIWAWGWTGFGSGNVIDSATKIEHVPLPKPQIPIFTDDQFSYGVKGQLEYSV